MVNPCLNHYPVCISFLFCCIVYQLQMDISRTSLIVTRNGETEIDSVVDAFQTAFTFKDCSRREISLSGNIDVETRCIFQIYQHCVDSDISVVEG